MPGARRRPQAPFAGQNSQLDPFSSSSAIKRGRERRNLRDQRISWLEILQACRLQHNQRFPLAAGSPPCRKAIGFLNQAMHREATLLD